LHLTASGESIEDFIKRLEPELKRLMKASDE